MTKVGYLVASIALVLAALLQPMPAFAQSGGNVYLPLLNGGSSLELQSGAAPTLYRVYVRSQEELNRVAAEIDVWEEAIAADPGYVLAVLRTDQINTLLKENIRIEIDQERTAELARMLAPFFSDGVSAASIDTIPSYACYRTVEETYSSLAQLATNNPNLATWSDIGDSWDKKTAGGPAGYDLQALVLTNKSIPGPKPKFLLMAAIHAREYTTAELATRFAEYLVNNYNVDADVTWLLDHFELHLVPQVNPDGRKVAEGGVLWRKNRNNTNGCVNTSQFGVDLNRNSSFKWNNGGSSSNACNETYRGSSAASEPEVQTIQSYAAGIFPDRRGPNNTDAAPADTEGLFITLHSYGGLVLVPWGWSTTTTAPNTPALNTLGRKLGYYNNYQVCNGPVCLYATSGTTDDWTYGELGVASYTIELGTAFFQQCADFENTILPTNIPALLYAFKAARRPYQSPAGPDSVGVAVSAGNVPAGTVVQLTATANDTRYNSNGWGTEATQAIAAARYTIDTPSWQGGVTYAMAAGDGSFSAVTEQLTASIDTSALAAGRHTIFVESQDAAGNWGVPSAVFLTVQAGSATATPTATATNTPVPPTATATNTPAPPTATATETPTGPTATPTNTPLPPTATATNTPAPPTATPTNTPAGPVTVFNDTFETSLGWVINPNGTDTASLGRWQRGDPQQTTSGSVVLQLNATTSGVNSLVTAASAGSSAGANDVDGGLTSVRSPAITLPAAGTITLRFWYNFALLSNATSSDYFRASVVGSSTTMLFEQRGAGANRAGQWQQITLNLSAYAGQTVRILFETADAGTASLVEAQVDDVQITAQ